MIVCIWRSVHDVVVFCCACFHVARSRSKSMIQPSCAATSAEFERREPGKRVRSQSESVTDHHRVSPFTSAASSSLLSLLFSSVSSSLLSLLFCSLLFSSLLFCSVLCSQPWCSYVGDTQSRNLRKKLAQVFLSKFLPSNFRASSCKFGWRHIK